MKTIASHISSLLSQNLRCRAGEATQPHLTEWKHKSAAGIDELIREHLPHGSGIDSGVEFDFNASKPDNLVFTFGFHHMDENGYYDGWTDHTCVVRPTLADGPDIKITGRDRNGIKDYLGEIFQYSLTRLLPERWETRESLSRAFTLWIPCLGNPCFPAKPVTYSVS